MKQKKKISFRRESNSNQENLTNQKKTTTTTATKKGVIYKQAIFAWRSQADFNNEYKWINYLNSSGGVNNLLQINLAKIQDGPAFLVNILPRSKNNLITH